MKIGVTGGSKSGKSLYVKYLLDNIPGSRYVSSCDEMRNVETGVLIFEYTSNCNICIRPDIVVFIDTESHIVVNRSPGAAASDRDELHKHRMSADIIIPNNNGFNFTAINLVVEFANRKRV